MTLRAAELPICAYCGRDLPPGSWQPAHDGRVRCEAKPCQDADRRARVAATPRRRGRRRR